jgi:PAS domain S-box-containing protein
MASEGLTPDFEQFFVNSLDLMAIADGEGYFRLVNPAFSQALGWTMQDLLEQPFMSFVHPDDVELTTHTYEDQAAGGAVEKIENRYLCRDGSYRWLEWSATALDDGLLYANARDITVRKELEAELQESEAMNRSVLETAYTAIITIDESGLVESFNPSAERTFDYAAEEVIGRNVRMLMPEPYQGEHDQYLARYLETGERKIIGIGRELEGRRKDGAVFPIELTISEVRTSTRRMFAGFMRDITERRAAAFAIEEARAAAVEANLAKSHFLSRMSHELRTPLNSVLGFAQILEMHLASKDDLENARNIYKAGQHLLELINEVLDISRIESGTMTVSLEPVPLEVLVRDCLHLVSPQAAERGIQIIDHDGRGRHVRGDHQRIKQVLLNLLSNAIKFNRDFGSVTVSCDAREGWARVSIADTGPGIAAELQERLFVPFDRLGADGVEGTGLGLVLSQRLVEAMGGKLGVDSTPGEGSTFWFELPIGADEKAADDREWSHEDVPTAAIHRATLLYIEDNLANVHLIEQLLRSRPEIRLLSALQGSLGIELAVQHRPDLILLDVHLPDIPGLDVFQRLRSDARTAAIPVVVVSADATKDQIRRFRDAGADDYVTKPIDMRRLLLLLDEFLGTSSIAPEVEPEE